VDTVEILCHKSAKYMFFLKPKTVVKVQPTLCSCCAVKLRIADILCPRTKNYSGIFCRTTKIYSVIFPKVQTFHIQLQQLNLKVIHPHCALFELCKAVL
jgi:hypothetical protein